MEIHFYMYIYIYSSIMSDIILLPTSTSKLFEVFCARLPLVKGVASIGKVQLSPSPYERIHWTCWMHRSQLLGVNAWKSSTHPWRLKAGVRRMLGSLTFPHSCHLTSWRKHGNTQLKAPELANPLRNCWNNPRRMERSVPVSSIFCALHENFVEHKHGKKVKQWRLK